MTNESVDAAFDRAFDLADREKAGEDISEDEIGSAFAVAIKEFRKLNRAEKAAAEGRPDEPTNP